MKQVWILNHYAAEPDGVGGTRHFHLAERLPRHGWEASVIASSVELNSGRQRLDDGESCRVDIARGVRFLWLRVPHYSGNGVGRMLNMFAFSVGALRRSFTGALPQPDVIVGSSVHPFAAAAGALLARRHRVPFIFEVRDLWPQTLIDLGRISEKSLAARLMRQLERWLCRRAARVIVLLPKASDYYVPLGVPGERVLWIPNGVDLSMFGRQEWMPRRGSELFTLMYFGAHGEANGLENVLRAMALLQERNLPVRLRLIGDGPRKPALVSLATDLALSNTEFSPPVPKSRIPGLAAEADAFVFNLVDAPVFRYGISSNKLFDFLAAGRPIVFCCDAANNPVAEAGAGVTVRPGNPAALADAIASLIAVPESERKAMGERGRTHVEENYGFDALAGRFAAALNDCLFESGASGR